MIALVGLLAGCPRPTPPPVVPAPPPAPVSADARTLLIGPTTWSEPDGALALDVPEGWGGSAGPAPVLLDLTQETSGFGLQIRTWAVGEDPPARVGFAVLFEDAGTYRDVPGLGPQVGTRTWQADDGRTVQSWFATLGERVVEVAALYPAGRSIEGREAVGALLVGLRGPSAPPD